LANWETGSRKQANAIKSNSYSTSKPITGEHCWFFISLIGRGHSLKLFVLQSPGHCLEKLCSSKQIAFFVNNSKQPSERGAMFSYFDGFLSRNNWRGIAFSRITFV